MLGYDTVTKETQQLDVDLGRSCVDPVPYLLCPHMEDFVVAVRDKENKSAVFLVQTCGDSR